MVEEMQMGAVYLYPELHQDLKKNILCSIVAN